MSPQKIHQTAIQALADFQLLEEGIRTYLDIAYATIRGATKNVIRFRFDRKCFEKDSLGKLVDKFSRLNSNDALISKLRQAVSERNRIAHSGLLLSLNDLAPLNLRARTVEYAAIHKKASALVREVIQEVLSLELRRKVK